MFIQNFILTPFTIRPTCNKSLRLTSLVWDATKIEFKNFEIKKKKILGKNYMNFLYKGLLCSNVETCSI